IRNVATAARVQSLSAHQVYGCLGCNMRCGRCARTVKQILSEALIGAQSLERPYMLPPAVPNEGARPANVCCTAGFRSDNPQQTRCLVGAAWCSCACPSCSTCGPARLSALIGRRATTCDHCEQGNSAIA